MGTHTVEKIGGTSMSAFDHVLKSVIIGSRVGAELYNRVFVVSAYAGITDLLLENKKDGRPGVYKRFSRLDPSWRESLAAVEKNMYAINAGFASLGLDTKVADEFVRVRIEGIRSCLSSLRRICSYGHFQLEEHLPTVRELLTSVGEAHSAFNAVDILKAKGVNAVLVDLSGWKDEEILPFDEEVRTAFVNIDVTKQLPIVTGYTKCVEGILSTYDRGYTEITFSKVAVITGAREGVIHKEFHLSTGDPKVIGENKVRVIGMTNYDVADQLADLGMEAIHPRASKNMERHGIPIRVKNTFDPDNPGTVITKNTYRTDQPQVQMVTGRKNMLGVEVHDPDMVGQSGYDCDLMSYLKKYDISYVAKNTNANTITHYVPQNYKNLDSCLADIRKAFPSAEIRTVPVAIVSAIGCYMKVPGFLAKAANALAQSNINILALDQCMRQVNMQFIVAEDDFVPAIQALHHGLVENISDSAPLA